MGGHKAVKDGKARREKKRSEKQDHPSQGMSLFWRTIPLTARHTATQAPA